MTSIPLLTATLLQEADSLAAGDGWSLQYIFAPENAFGIARAALILFVGLPLALVVSRAAQRWVASRFGPQRGLVFGKLFLYVAAGIVLVSAMAEAGFSLAPLLGAAGILGIAIGFAAQTSVSNVISGFFLMGEQPFRVDDMIQVGSTTGRVISIDMMSVKLRTFDNKFVRIPNETIVKSEVTTVTRFPLRRIDIDIGIAYKEDVGQVRPILLDVVEKNPRVLSDPEPSVRVVGFGDSGVNLRLLAWTTQEHWWDLRTALHEEAKARLDAEGIEIPFPHRTLYSGAATDPLPVRIVADGPEPSGSEREGPDAEASEADREPEDADGREGEQPRSSGPDAGAGRTREEPERATDEAEEEDGGGRRKG